ncbi:MAG: cytochrome B6 [Candidatus Caldatribacteriota bacterium]
MKKLYLIILCLPLFAHGQKSEKVSSYMKVDQTEKFDSVVKRMSKEKKPLAKKQRALLEERYDLSNKASKTKMFRGKPIQEGIRVKLPKGVKSWEELAEMSPEEIKKKGLFPKGFLPLPHPNHAEGGMVFPQFHINKIKEQDNRDLTRFDLEFDLPDHFLPEFPPAIFLTTRKDLGDVSQGQVVTQANFFQLFNGILTPKQLTGLRLLVTPFPQQQFNATDDRRSLKASQGVTCFDCHVNGHTNATTHLVGDIRPQEFRNRIDTPTLRGVNQQRLFGSQRALKTIEDFTEFEQRGAYFDGDTVIGIKKGINILDRGSQVHDMSEFQAILDFPPAPKLNVVDGKLDPSKATEAELRGQEIFFGKGQCFQCHNTAIYSDNLMHDLRAERFYDLQNINGRVTKADGPIKTFPLRGIKESPPYLHDGRLLTLEDTVEYFNLILGTKLTKNEKQDLVEFLKVL